MKDTFRFFIRKNYPHIKIENVLIDKIGEDFQVYLDEKLTEEQKEKILPKGAMDVIMNMDNPLRENGFHPAYVIHFTEFIEDLKKSIKL